MIERFFYNGKNWTRKNESDHIAIVTLQDGDPASKAVTVALPQFYRDDWNDLDRQAIEEMALAMQEAARQEAEAHIQKWRVNQRLSFTARAKVGEKKDQIPDLVPDDPRAEKLKARREKAREKAKAEAERRKAEEANPPKPPSKKK